MLFAITIALFSVFLFFSLRLLSAYLVPAILHYNYSYDFFNLFRIYQNSSAEFNALTYYNARPLSSFYIFTTRRFFSSSTFLLNGIDRSEMTSVRMHTIYFVSGQKIYMLYGPDAIAAILVIQEPLVGYFDMCSSNKNFVVNSKLYTLKVSK
jgi:hypothetical protein